MRFVAACVVTVFTNGTIEAMADLFDEYRPAASRSATA
jgi:hypothetical protein